MPNESSLTTPSQFEINNYCTEIFLKTDKISTKISTTVCYSIGNTTANFNYFNTHALNLFNPSLQHLVVDKSISPEWAFHILDSQHNRPTLPTIKSVEKLYRGVSEYESKANYCFQYLKQLDTVLILDYKKKRGIWWSGSITGIPEHEKIFPLRHIMQAIFHPIGGTILHGAVVGKCGKGAFLVGKSGVGKSTTSIACLTSGMDFIGDDQILHYEDSAYSISQFAKLNRKSHKLLPKLRIAELNCGETKEGKLILSLFPFFKSQLASSLKIVTILIPTLTENNLPSLSPCSPTDTLKAIAPSSFSQVFNNHQEEMSRMAKLARAIPAYKLNITQNLSAVVNLIDEIINK